MVKTNPMKIPGNWREGYVLDFHTIRSDFLEQGLHHDDCIYRRLPKNNETEQGHSKQVR